jgi:hypothetical protein
MRATFVNVLLLSAFACPVGAYAQSSCATARQTETTYGNKAATNIITLVIDNWMQNVKADWQSSQEQTTSQSKVEIPAPQPKWVLIDSSCVPLGFHLRTYGIPIKALHPLPEVIPRGYFYIFVVQFEVQQNRSIRVVFAYYDWRIGGATVVTYLASRREGAWSVQLVEAFSP